MRPILHLFRPFFSHCSKALAQGRPVPGLILFALFVALGIGLSLVPGIAAHRAIAQTSPTAPSSQVGTVDAVPEQFQLGKSLYLESCATCHVGVPPEVLPRQTWEIILQDTAHYGVQLPPLVDPPRLLIWQYIQQFSRSLRTNEATPYRIRNSRFFEALHPRVEFAEPIRLAACISCHPSASSFNFRHLSQEWQDAP